jgi:chromosomal replication initiation ATPase DnaA
MTINHQAISAILREAERKIKDEQGVHVKLMYDGPQVSRYAAMVTTDYVCEVTDTEHKIILSKNRTTDVVFARNVLAYALHTLGLKPYLICEYTGHSDRTSVIHALQTTRSKIALKDYSYETTCQFIDAFIKNKTKK